MNPDDMFVAGCIGTCTCMHVRASLTELAGQRARVQLKVGWLQTADRLLPHPTLQALCREVPGQPGCLLPGGKLSSWLLGYPGCHTRPRHGCPLNRPGSCLQSQKCVPRPAAHPCCCPTLCSCLQDYVAAHLKLSELGVEWCAAATGCCNLGFCCCAASCCPYRCYCRRRCCCCHHACTTAASSGWSDELHTVERKGRWIKRPYVHNENTPAA